MLITRCPQCGTTFKVKAQDLEQASGHVRCGRCSAVFDAYKELRQSLDPEVTGAYQFRGLEEDADPDALSPDETDRLEEELTAAGSGDSIPDSAHEEEQPVEEMEPEAELGALEPEPEPEPEPEQGAPEGEPEKEVASADRVGTEDDPESLAQGEDDSEIPLEVADMLAENAQDPGDEPDESSGSETDPEGSTEAEEGEGLNRPSERAIETTEMHSEEVVLDGGTDSDMEFDLPKEEWQDFFADTLADGEEIPAISDTGVEWVVLSSDEVQSEQHVEPVDGVSPEASEDEAQEQADSSDDEDEAQEQADSSGNEDESAGTDERDPDADSEFSPPEDPQRALDEEGTVMDLAVGSTSVTDQDNEEEPEDNLFSMIEAVPEETAPTQPTRRYWAMGSAALVLLFLSQLVHHNRNALADHAAAGPVVRSVYGLVGSDLNAGWDLSQYQINKWVATSDAESPGTPSLRITAQIENRGPKSQPFPLVQVALKDRWDESVAGRVFEPAEYLAGANLGREMMAAGTSVQAELRVIDPGRDAYGFELDVCLRTPGKGLQCANDPAL